MLLRYSQKEAKHISLLRKKDAQIAAQDQEISKQRATNEHTTAELNESFDDLSDALEKILDIKIALNEKNTQHNALRQRHVKLEGKIHELEQQLARKSSEIEQAVET